MVGEWFAATAKSRLATQQLVHVEAQLQAAADANKYELVVQVSAVVAIFICSPTSCLMVVTNIERVPNYNYLRSLCDFSSFL